MTTLRGGLADVAGLRVGQHTVRGDGYLTGCTVVLAPPGGMVAGVDVRGSAPGTRETDLLDPTAIVDRVHALLLTGGSAFGLAAADGVVAALADRRSGFSVGADPDFVVPIVPAAVLFDLGRGGTFRATPDARFGYQAVQNALVASAAEMGAEGVVGAGTGACCGGLKGGIGQAGARLPDGSTVAALVASNATGSIYDPASGRLWASPLLTADDGPGLRPPSAPDLQRLQRHAELTRLAVEKLPSDPRAASIRHTTLGVIATDATLTKAQCAKLAAIAHDGLARAVNPVHTLFDGDLFFAASTVVRPVPDPAGLYRLLAAAADVVSRAVIRSVLAAESVTTAGGSWPSYADLAPSTVNR